MVIDFSGTAGQITEAFHTEIHHLSVNGQPHVANMSDPRIPAALAPTVVGVVSLHDFRPTPQLQRAPEYTESCTAPHPTSCQCPAGQTCYDVLPPDLATIYNLNPLFKAGISGQDQTIAVVEQSDVNEPADWTTFRSIRSHHHVPDRVLDTDTSGGCTDPSTNGAEEEAILDTEWASAAAPSATIELASCANTNSTAGEFIALENLLNSTTPPPAIVSISYGIAETVLGQAANAAINSLYQTAALKDVSVFVAAGDWGAAVADNSLVHTAFEQEASRGITVSGFASTQYNVAVGGTDFGDTYAGMNSTYWNSTNSTTYGSARSYIPEIPWNDSCGSQLAANYLTYEGHAGVSTAYELCNSALALLFTPPLLNISAGSGGPSQCATGAPSSSTPGVVSNTCQGYPKPSWQSILNNPNDGVRDLPDVSLFASDDLALWGHSYFIYDSGDGGWLDGWGGTSFGAPVMAGIQALVNEYTNEPWGNPDPVYYALARAEYGTSGSATCNSTGTEVGGSCIFYDVTMGDMDVPSIDSNNCYNPAGFAC
jgi:subtilase family serine protease